ncbi:M48 family metallopeptidase [Pseudoalteromonas shioyasakiensis]|uniref:M48 family metallopeptidase n=1 Tax=Pseudoalteromonas shioyasakiensis TaxID=1190813 RepID=UPI00211751F2|nr:M48 family metallopeptidase [Pseudoalteromonas shioyasakiensis]MCQ8877693.1 M48 family metallopeptidase [Pseudoalteromonas shioyasakiensis]
MSKHYIKGCYYYPNSSQHQQCFAASNKSQIQLVDSQQRNTLLSVLITECQIESPLPGVASELNFAGGGRFVPEDINHRWAFTHTKTGMSERLEKSKPLILASVILIPLLLWFILYRGIPAIAVYSVSLASPATVEAMGNQSLKVIEKVALAPSQLPDETQNNIQQQWQQMLDELNLDSTIFRLSFYQSDYFAANAFALPHGRVIVTDELVTLLKDKPDALRAILLHEIGHVEYQHGIRLAAQATASTIVLAVIFGDLEGITEVVLGSSSSFLQQAFSRDMEREADKYAIEKLIALGYSNNDFADAIQALQNKLDEQAQLDDSWFKYLSTHPSSQERIDFARQYTPQ